MSDLIFTVPTRLLLPIVPIHVDQRPFSEEERIMSRAHTLNMFHDRIRTTFRWKWTVLLVTLGGLAFGFGLSLSQNRARAQVSGGGVPQPAQAPQLPPMEQPTEHIMHRKIAYFYFSQEGAAVLYFPSARPLVLAGANTRKIYDYMQAPIIINGNQMKTSDALFHMKIGRYYINPEHLCYTQANVSGGLTAVFSGCPSIELNGEEANALSQRIVVPPTPAPAGGVPVPTPAPAGGVPVRPPSASEESVLPPPPTPTTPR